MASLRAILQQRTTYTGILLKSSTHMLNDVTLRDLAFPKWRKAFVTGQILVYRFLWGLACEVLLDTGSW